MQIEVARARAESLMREHGLVGWRLVFDGAKMRAGICRADRREIGLSRVLTQLHSEAEVLDTVLHEIAHALVGPKHGHDAEWQAKARAIGCTGQRCVPTSSARAPAAWVGTCPSGHTTSRHRRPERVQSCRRCSTAFDAGALFTWRLHGQSVPMHPRYVAELARVLAAEAPGRPGTPGAGRSAPAPVPATSSALAVGTEVRLLGSGRFAGLPGTVVKRGRTRYQVQTRSGLVAAPFELVVPLPGAPDGGGRAGASAGASAAAGSQADLGAAARGSSRGRGLSESAGRGSGRRGDVDGLEGGE